MDIPKLTLVENCSIPGDRSNFNSKVESEGEWVVDARDLEGMDAEEIMEDDSNVADGIGSQEVLQIGGVNSAEESEDEDDEDDGGGGENNAFEFSKCAECDRKNCSRPVQEICGHFKCRACFMASYEGCRQCFMSLEGTQEESQIESIPEVEKKPFTPDDHTDDEDEERVVVKPDEYIFELGGESGRKSLAVVSAETLQELGIEPPNDNAVSDEEDDDGEGEEEESAPITQDEGIPSSPEQIENEEANDSQDSHSSAEDTPSKRRKGRGKKKKPEHSDHIVPIPSDNTAADKKSKIVSEAGTAAANAQKYKCLKCEKVFWQKYQHLYHLYCNPLNGRRPFICHCSEEFVSLSHYQYHVRSKHTGEKPYECPVCSLRFIQKVKLNRHMTTHTSKPGKKAGSANSSVYLCAYCKKRFNSLSSCRRHIGGHTEERPFACETCGKAFKQKYSLELHARTHQNIRPYKCPDCDKAFSTAKDMRRHHLCHTGEVPFECTFADCSVKFRRKDNLERHIRTTHKLSEKVTKLMSAEAVEKYLETKKQKTTKKNKKKNKNRRDDDESDEQEQQLFDIDDAIEVITGI